MSFNLVKTVVLKFLREAFLALSKVDGKPGLSLNDLTMLVARVKSANDNFSDDGQWKADAVADWLIEHGKGRFPAWTVKLLTYLAYLYARRAGVIP